MGNISFESFFDKSTYSQISLGSLFKSTGETIFTHERGQAGALFGLDCTDLRSCQAKELIIQLERKIQEVLNVSLMPKKRGQNMGFYPQTNKNKTK